MDLHSCDFFSFSFDLFCAIRLRRSVHCAGSTRLFGFSDFSSCIVTTQAASAVIDDDEQQPGSLLRALEVLRGPFVSEPEPAFFVKMPGLLSSYNHVRHVLFTVL
jgi:hypothetical protein